MNTEFELCFCMQVAKEEIIPANALFMRVLSLASTYPELNGVISKPRLLMNTLDQRIFLSSLASATLGFHCPGFMTGYDATLWLIFSR